GHNGFRPGRSDFDKTARLFNNLIPHIIKTSRLWLGNDFLIGERCLCSRVPIDHPTAAIDEAFVIKIDEGPEDSAGIFFIKRIALPRPIAGTTEPLELFDDNPSVFILPFHYAA